MYWGAWQIVRARRDITETEPNKVHNSLHTADRIQDTGKDNKGLLQCKGSSVDDGQKTKGAGRLEGQI